MPTDEEAVALALFSGEKINGFHITKVRAAIAALDANRAERAGGVDGLARELFDRRQIVTIDRVTPSGRAVVGDLTFNPDGFERGAEPYHEKKLEPLTAAIEEEVALFDRARTAELKVWDARIERAGEVSPAGSLPGCLREAPCAPRASPALAPVWL